MAVSRAQNVILATADGDTLSGATQICGIKVVGGASGMTVNLKDAGTSGTVLYTATVGNNASSYEEVEIRAQAGVYVNISAGDGTVYLYLGV